MLAESRDAIADIAGTRKRCGQVHPGEISELGKFSRFPIGTGRRRADHVQARYKTAICTFGMFLHPAPPSYGIWYEGWLVSILNAIHPDPDAARGIYAANAIWKKTGLAGIGLGWRGRLDVD